MNNTMMKTVRKRTVLFLIALISISAGCEQEEVPYLVGEQKNIEGSWKIAQASMNGDDLTPWGDFSQFRLQIGADNTYTLENQIPFMVDRNGTWAFDDPVFPTEISFTPEGSSTPVTSRFVFPIVSGKRMINVTFSAGCSSNKYEYTFERVPDAH